MLEQEQAAPAATSAATEDTAPDYAIVEIFGHLKHVGRICEVEKFGTKMLRIDVPKDGKFEKGFLTHFVGGAAIFRLTLCDLATVERANKPYESASRLSYQPRDDDGEGYLDDHPP